MWCIIQMYLSGDPLPSYTLLYGFVEKSLCILLFTASWTIPTLPNLHLPCLEPPTLVDFGRCVTAVKEACKHLIDLLLVFVLVLFYSVHQDLLLMLICLHSWDSTLVECNLLYYFGFSRLFIYALVSLQINVWVIGLSISSITTLLPDCAHNCTRRKNLIYLIQFFDGLLD